MDYGTVRWINNNDLYGMSFLWRYFVLGLAKKMEIHEVFVGRLDLGELFIFFVARD